MKQAYSEIIAEEHIYILPGQNMRSLSCMTDTGMVICSGLERTQKRWTNLMNSVGL